ncbi:MAG: hypothetical protein ACREBU_24635, partial [Nitrososphaera sp.]
MNNQKVLATFVVAVLAASLLSVVGITAIPLEKAIAQAITIRTSADTHGGTFFGHGVLQVVVTDPDATDDDTQETIFVDIDADADIGTATTGNFEIFETSQSSGRFEFFLVHAASPFADGDGTPADTLLDAINPNGADIVGAEGVAPTGQASIITFGPGGNLDTGAGSVLFTDFSFDINAGAGDTTVDYEEAIPQVTTDRPTYGTTSIMYLVIEDQDANEDPTNADVFVVANGTELETLFDLSGASFNGSVTFTETGDNTAEMEATIQLADSGSGADTLVVTTEAVTGTLNDKATYEPVTDLNNTSTDSDSFSFDVDDVDGDLGTIGTVTFGSELSPTVTDLDANTDSQDDDG